MSVPPLDPSWNNRPLTLLRDRPADEHRVCVSCDALKPLCAFEGGRRKCRTCLRIEANRRANARYREDPEHRVRMLATARALRRLKRAFPAEFEVLLREELER